MTKKIKNKNLRNLINSLIVLAILFTATEAAYFVFAKPMIEKTIKEKVYVSSDSLYILNFNDLKFSFISGRLLLTEFVLSADTSAYFKTKKFYNKNLYHIELDTFKITKLNLFKFLGIQKTLNIEQLHLINPQLKIFGLKENDTTSSLKKKSASYETVRSDIISSAFSFVNSMKIEKIRITKGNFDFLKPRDDNPNPFSIKSVTFLLNDFYADKKTFSKHRKDIFSEDMTLIIDQYRLKLNDNIHILSADKVQVSTKKQKIELFGINLDTKDIPKNKLAKIDSNIFNFNIKKIELNNANFKEIYVNNQISISSALINNFSAIIYNQKNKKKKNSFNKDSLLNKIDFYPLFKDYLKFVNIDTLKIDNANFKNFNNIKSNLPNTQVANFDVTVFDFLIDSTSILDTSRILYSKNFLINIYGIKKHLKDSIHSVTADYLVATSKHNAVMATNIKITPNTNLRYWARKRKKSFNNAKIQRLSISGFNFPKYFNSNQIFIDKISLSGSNISIKNFTDKKNKKNRSKNTTPINELFLNFADKMLIKKVNISSGYLNYNSFYRDKINSFKGKYKLNIQNLTFDPYNKKITKLTKVSDMKFMLLDFKYTTPDSIYFLLADSLSYSSYNAQLFITNVELLPFEQNITKRLKEKNKSATIGIKIPKIKISNTNLSNAFQVDSLSLKNILLKKPVFDVNIYPAINFKDEKKVFFKNYKKQAIRNIISFATETKVYAYDNTDNFDDSNYNLLKTKRSFIDSISKYAIKSILNINLNPKTFSKDDKNIPVIERLEKTAIDSIKFIDKEDINIKKINELFFATKHEFRNIVNSYNQPKIDKNDIYKIVGSILPKINSDSLLINNGFINIVQIDENKKSKKIFSSHFNLKLSNFNFDTTLIDSNRNIFFSECFFVNIKNTVFNLPDSIHQLKINNISLKSADSLISIDRISIFSKKQDSSKLQIKASLNNIKLKSTDFDELYFNKKLKITDFNINSPKINIYLPDNENKKNEEFNFPLKILLPKQLNEILIDNINFKNGKINLFHKNSKFKINANFNLKISNFFIDSLTDIKKNKYFIPVENLILNIENFYFQDKDSSKNIYAKNINLNAQKGNFNIKNLQFLSNYDKKSDLYEICKNKNLFNIKIPTVKFTNIDFEKLRFKKELFFSRLIADSVSFKLTKKKSKKTKKIDITEIDAYKLIKKYIPKIKSKEIEISNINATINSLSDSTKKTQQINNLSFNLSNILIDSTTKITSPNLFYAENLRFEAKKIKKFIQDSIYIIEIGKIKGSTLTKSLEIFDLYYHPIVPISEVQYLDKFNDGYRVTALSGYSNKLSIRDFNYKKALVKNEIDINLIRGDSVFIDIFNNKTYPHNDFIRKEHLVGYFFKIDIPFDINTVIFSDFNVFYKEINTIDKKVAYVSVNNTNLKIFKITNDSIKIRKKDLYTTIKANGYLNNAAPLNLEIKYELKSKGNFARIKGEIGKCNASIFNTYTINGINLKLEKGTIKKINFDFNTIDTIAIGRMKMQYNNLKAYLISKDTTNPRKLKFISWIGNTLLLRNNNPKYGVYLKVGAIGYIHDPSYSDFKMWVKALLSGIQSTIAFDPKDVRKIKKIRRKNKKLLRKR